MTCPECQLEGDHDVTRANDFDKSQCVTALKAEVARLQGEISAVDMAMERRDALDAIPNRVDKILHAIHVAGEIDPLRAENRRLRDAQGDRVARTLLREIEVMDEQRAVEAERDTLRADVARLSAEVERMETTTSDAVRELTIRHIALAREAGTIRAALQQAEQEAAELRKIGSKMVLDCPDEQVRRDWFAAVDRPEATRKRVTPHDLLRRDPQLDADIEAEGDPENGEVTLAQSLQAQLTAATAARDTATEEARRLREALTELTWRLETLAERGDIALDDLPITNKATKKARAALAGKP